MRKRCQRIICFFLAAFFLFLSACGTTSDSASTESVPTETEVPESSESVSEELDPKGAVDREGIYQCYLQAMQKMISTVTLDVSEITWEYGAENDLNNIYYKVLSDHPELKYTYDVHGSVDNGIAVCEFSYMPYKTGAFDAGVPDGYREIRSLLDVKQTAQEMIGVTDQFPIAISNRDLDVLDIQYALAQAGYGWICYSLSRDGTELIANPAVGMTMDECVTGINESFRIAREIVDQLVTEDMTEREQVWVLYDYIARNVRYDFRYYNDRANMPYTSTVALGALRDGVAICGGYSQAFQTLLDLVGIENYTVSGVSSGEYHMWNYVILDGEGYYCDPTAQRGGGDSRFLRTAEEWDSIGGYEWDRNRWPYL